MMRWFSGVVLTVGLFACGASAPEAESAVLAESPPALAPGSYEMVAPALTGYPCSAIVTVVVTVAADGSETADACPEGWSCAHDAEAPLGGTYSALLPKSLGTVCSYDASAASFAPAR